MARMRMMALLAAALLVLAACGGDTGADTAQGGDEEPAAGGSEGGEGGEAEGGPISFLSLAWQEQSVAANERIVEAWNEEHPDTPVEYVQGDWDNVQDYLLTSFEGGEVPDVFHYESAEITGFADDGYLTDLSGLLSEDLRSDIVEGAWETVEDDGAIYGVPFLWESRIGLYNAALFEEAGVEPPTVDDPWTWEEFREAAQQLTVDENGDGTPEQYGAAFGLSSPTNFVMNLSQNFDGDFFYEEGGTYTVDVGEAEAAVPTTVHDMIYEDGSATPDGVSLSGTELFPGFFEGRYAMLPGIGVWARQQVVEGAPEGFEWGIFPPLEGESQAQGSATQTLSVPADSEHPETAVAFIEYFLSAENMAELALGDWLLPTRQSAAELPELTTEEAGWDVASASVEHLGLAPYQVVRGYGEWSDRIATPTLQEYFSDRISWEEAATRLEEGGNEVLADYQED
jgi:multiple sugar transport system substrate-binding protein